MVPYANVPLRSLRFWKLLFLLDAAGHKSDQNISKPSKMSSSTNDALWKALLAYPMPWNHLAEQNQADGAF